MNLKRFALLGAFVALVAVVGAGAFSAKPASALTTSTKICTPTSAGTPAGGFPFTPAVGSTTVTLNCTLTINAGAPVFIPPNTTIQVTLIGAGATFTNVSLIGQCGGNAFISTAAPTAFNVFPAPPTFPAGTAVSPPLAGLTTFAPGLLGQSYFVSVTNPLGCFDGSLSISEVITLPAAAVAAGSIGQQLTPVINPGALPAATVIATGPGGQPLVIALPTPVFGGVTPGGPFPVTITLAGCSVGATFVSTSLVTTINPGQSAVCRFDLDDNEPGFLATSVAGVTTGTTTCTTATGTFPTQAAITAGGATALAASECVSSGQIVGTFTSTITGATLNGLPIATGGTFTLRCPGGTVTAANACDFVDIPIVTSAATTIGGTAALGAITITLNYDPDIDAQNTGAQATFTVITIITPVIAPNAFVPRVTCATLASATLPGFTLGNAIFGFGAGAVLPGQLGVNSLVAISVLPVPINCSLTFFTSNLATATQVAIPAGTIEVSSIQGALIDASGRLSTNLRIGCGGTVGGDLVVGTPVVVDAVNSCVGVTFSVAGVGVGLAEVRLRYEPRNPIFPEFEVAFAVAFVAPQAVLDLTLAPNPVSAGGTSTAGTSTSDGVATLTLNPTFGANIFRDPITNLPFLDPTTGQPLLLNSGSILNGSVIFTIDNTAIARFVGAGLSTLGTSTTTTATSVTNTTTAVAATSDTVIVRCGTLSQTINANASAAGLLPFFGGCRTASVGYRGIVAGSANITATFVPDLPGAVNSTSLQGLGLATSAFTGFSQLNFSGFTPSSITRQLQVLDAPVSGTINLVRGCNNVSPTVTESVSAFIARAQGTTVISVFEYQAATNTFLGAPGPGAPAGAPGDLAGVTRLRPVFICVTGPGTLNQPAA